MTAILKVDTIQDTAGNNIINESSDTITIGASGDTISIPSGATIANSGTATGFGKIVQIVMGTTATAVGTDSTSYINTGLTASITPTSSSNKVLVLVSQIATVIQDTNSTRDTDFILVRGSTTIARNYSQTISPTATTRFHITNSINYLDTPNTTSATAYKTQVKGSGSGWDIYLQKDNVSDSQIILMEVAG